MGAPYYDDDDCIDCGMCIASTKDEMIAATQKIRAHLKATRKQGPPIGKIAIAGKGGVGKSSVTTLMTNILLEKGYQVNVMDTDDSNPGLHFKLGLQNEPVPLMTLLERFGKEDGNGSWLSGECISMQDIPRQYIEKKDGLRFLMAGKISDPFQGCACSIADLARDFVSKLSMSEDELLLIDMEAGVESFGRGVERNVDTLLMVVEPSYDSIALAEKMNYMALGMGIRRVRAVMNKISSDSIQLQIANELQKKNIKTIGSVYFDEELNSAGFLGKQLPDSTATDEMRMAVNTLFQ
jgi:CO dehydrogenase maturation factor